MRKLLKYYKGLGKMWRHPRWKINLKVCAGLEEKVTN